MKFTSLLIFTILISFNLFAHSYGLEAYGFKVQATRELLIITSENASDVGDVFRKKDATMKACYFGDLDLLIDAISRGQFDSVWGEWMLSEAFTINEELFFTYSEVGKVVSHQLKGCF